MAAESFSELSQFFYELSEEEREQLLAGEGLFEKRHISKGTVIFSEGDQNDELYLIRSGRVEISKKVGQRSGRRKILAILSKGTLFGEGALLSGRPRSATAKALVDLEVLVLIKKKFDAFVKEKPVDAITLLMALIRVVNERLIWTSHELVTLYDVMELVGQHRDDMTAFFEQIQGRLSGVTKATAGTIALKNASTGDYEVVAQWGRMKMNSSELSELATKLDEQRSITENHHFVASIRDLSGKFLGLMVMKKDDKWMLDEEKIAMAIADQLAVAIANTYQIENEKGRSKLKQKNIQF